MKKREPSAIGDVLENLKQSTELGLRLLQARVFDEWDEIAGPVLAPHGRPKNIDGLTLFIEVDSAVWMHRYAYRKWDIIRRINRLTGKELVSDLFFLLKEDEAQPAAKKRRKRRNPDQ